VGRNVIQKNVMKDKNYWKMEHAKIVIFIKELKKMESNVHLTNAMKGKF